MRIVFHTGMHRTATMSVQQWLRDHADALEAERIRALPLDMKTCVSWPQLYDPDGVRADVERARADGMDTLVYSHQIISTFSAADYKTLRAIFAGYEFSFVTMFRHWSSFWPSRWAQNCQRRDTQSLFDYIARSLADPARFEARLDLVLKRQGEVEDANRIALSYDWAMRGTGVVRTVLEACGVPDALLQAAKPDDAPLNVRPPQSRLDMIRLFNGVLAEAENQRPDEMYDAFGEGRPVAQFYGLGPAVSSLLKRDRELAVELSGMLSASSRSLRLCERDFDALRAALEETAAPLLRNGADGTVFPPLEDCVLTASELNVADLAPALRSRMLEALRQAG